MHSGLQEGEYLSSLEKECWWALRERIKSLINQHVEPTWGNSGNKRMIERKEKMRKVRLKPCNDSPCVFNFSFFFVWSSFCYRSSSWRFYMMVHQGFNPFSKCSLRFFSKELKYSSSCNPERNSFYFIIGGGIMSFLIIWPHGSWFTYC